MKIALDPFCHADVPFERLPHLTAEMDFENLELCSRDEFFPEYNPPRANDDRIRSFKEGLRECGVNLVSALVAYRWASPFEDEREAEPHDLGSGGGGVAKAQGRARLVGGGAVAA